MISFQVTRARPRRPGARRRARAAAAVAAGIISASGLSLGAGHGAFGTFYDKVTQAAGPGGPGTLQFELTVTRPWSSSFQARVGQPAEAGPPGRRMLRGYRHGASDRRRDRLESR